MLSVEKQLAMTLYYLKDQGSLAMTANAFGVALCTVSVVVRKVCDVIATVFFRYAPRYGMIMHTSYLPTGQWSRLKEAIQMQISSDIKPQEAA